MARKPLGCGVAAHDEDCLCDVKISGEPWEVRVTIPYDYFCGKEICEKFNLGVPWTGADLATFFEKISEVRAYIGRDGRINRYPTDDKEDGSLRQVQNNNAKLSHEQFAELKQWIRDGGQPTELKRRMFDVHKIEIHKSYVSKLRSRMMEKGEL